MSATSLPTPYLRLDVAKAQASIEAMAARARALGVGLRPHAKTHKSVRLGAVLEWASVAVGVDSTASLDAMAAHGIRPEVVVEVDSGHHRSGVSPEAAGEIGRYAADAGFVVRGVFTFPGHSYTP